MASQARLETHLRRAIGILDVPARWTGKVAAWLILPMVLVLVYEVISRYALDSPTVWAYDITYMLYGTLFLLGAAYALGRDSHVRADFLYNVLAPRYQGVIDAALYVTLFFPAIGVFTWIMLGYATTSWEMGERIPTSPWMPVIYPYKAVMPVMGILLLVQGVSELLKSLLAILTNERFRRS